MQVVFHAGPLNEFMLLLPLLRALDRPTTVVAPWQRASLAKRLIDASPMDIEMFEFTRLHAESGPSRVSPAVGDLFASATRIVSFLSSDEDHWARNVRQRAPSSEVYLLEPRPPSAFAGHFADWHREQLAGRGLSLTPAEPDPIDQPGGPVVVHPGGSAIKRCWPADRYEALIEHLRDAGVEVLPVFGEVERERWSNARLASWTDALEAKATRSVDELVPLLSRARMLIANDAGPMHLAAQLGVPTLAILGPTDPAKTGQRGAHVRHVGPPNGPGRIEDVTLDAVIDAVGLG
ncbi:MAG: glycosyltransferase family 9 protein [Phycisphaeraceae bacterium]